MDECLFCKIAKGELPSHKVWEDDKYVAFMDIFPIQKGHVLLIPKEHMDYIFETPEPTYTELFQRAKVLGLAIKRAMGTPRVAISVEGFQVPHLHVHLIPVSKRGDMNPSLATPSTMDDLSYYCEKIKEQL